jgi:transcriptional regulator with XRE-family HTH domain
MSDEDGGKATPPLSVRQVEVIWESMVAKRIRRTGDLAELAGLNRSYVSEIVNRRTGPGLSAIHKLATALELPVAAFLPGADPDQAIAAARMAPRLDREVVILAPKIGRGVADTAGGGQIEDYPPQQLTPVPERAAKGHQLASGEVRGDCLAPDLEPGDTAIIAIHEARPGQIVAV